MRLKHVALPVPDLARAEEFYAAVLGIEVITRESLGEDGVWRQAPPDVGWEQVRADGLDVHMVGLHRDGLVLALFPGRPDPGTIHFIGVVADEEEVAELRSSLPGGTTIEVDRSDALTFVAPFGFRWQLAGPEFLVPGTPGATGSDSTDRRPDVGHHRRDRRPPSRAAGDRAACHMLVPS